MPVRSFVILCLVSFWALGHFGSCAIYIDVLCHLCLI